MQLLDELGLQQAAHKAQPPATRVKWLGVIFDTETMQMIVPKEMICTTLELVQTWRLKREGTKQQFQRLLGKLFHVAQVARMLRLFCNRLLAAYRAAFQQRRIQLDEEGVQDLI